MVKPDMTRPDRPQQQFEGLLHRITNRIRQSLELQEILDAAAVEVRSFLDTDRVKVYRFYPDGHGEVIAESIQDQCLPSLLGLHFPADDIPAESREAFVKARQRVIVDVATQQICLNELTDRQTGTPLEVEDVRYRLVDPCHIEYLKAMGVQSSLVIPILHHDRLWGLLVSHHREPHPFSEEELQIAQLVADQVSIAIDQATLLAQARSKAQREAAINKVAVSLHRLTTIELQTALEETIATLNGSGGRLYRASDANGNPSLLQTCGDQPTLPSVFYESIIEQHILWREYFRPHAGEYTNPATYRVQNLYDEPRLRVLAPSFSHTAIGGLLVVVLAYRQQFLGYLSIFRDQVDTETVWAGQVDTDQRQIQPRNSFAAWRQTQRGAVEWTADEVELAQALANQFAIAIYKSELYQQAQAEIQQRQAVETTLRRQAEEDRLLTTILQRIRQSLNLETILDTTVAEVRHFLQTDRVLIYRFDPDWSGTVTAESVSFSHLSILGQIIHDPCFAANRLYEPYQNGHISQIEDATSNTLQPCYVDLLASLQVRANLVVPILMSRRKDSVLSLSPRLPDSPAPPLPHLWGLLIAHNCTAPRQWQSWEVHFLQQLAMQLAIALQQAELYQQVQALNVDLEHQVQERTATLQRSLEFEALLKRITDKVRDSLNEDHILQTAVAELAHGLDVSCCDAALYDLERRISTICYEQLRSKMSSGLGLNCRFDQRPEVYESLLAGGCFQFCSIHFSQIAMRTLDLQYAILCCPLMDDQGVLGDIWLFKPCQEQFDSLEIRLVQQIANQCAIALRQSRLYQAAQAQVEELARLNLLKDDFLSTVSHELRTPMSSIKLATQMLEVILKETGILEVEENKAAQYFQILNSECKREITLINNLLDLTRLDAGSEPLSPMAIDLTVWIPHVAEPFLQLAANQRQQLLIDISADLISITTDLLYLERILTELLNNACKYTPEGGEIRVGWRATGGRQRGLAEKPPLEAKGQEAAEQPDTFCPDTFCISVSNTGVVIPVEERDRVFDKFYRIPNNDPWKHGGTGLGLALVKKMAGYLGGSIELGAQSDRTTFTVTLPNLIADS